MWILFHLTRENAMRKGTLCLILFFTCTIFYSGTLAEEAPKKNPMPEQAVQDQVLGLIKDVFKDDYSKKTQLEKKTLAAKLSKQGQESKEDPVARYVLFQEAHKYFLQAKDPELALLMFSYLDKDYHLSPPVKVALLKPIGSLAYTAATSKSASEAAFKASKEAMEDDDFDSAIELILAAEEAAKKARSIQLVRQLSDYSNTLKARKMAYGEIKNAVETLLKKPNDLEANTSVGKYLCFVKGDWEKGMPMLAKGKDTYLKTLAEKDRACLENLEADGPAFQNVGDQWWKLGDEEKDVERKRQIQNRACFWYKKALPELKGLAKLQVEKRIGDSAPQLGVSTEATPQNLLKTDLKFDKAEGEWKFKEGMLTIGKPVAFGRFQIPVELGENYKLELHVERQMGANKGAFVLGIPVEGKLMSVVIDGAADKGFLSGISKIDGKEYLENPTCHRGVLFPRGRTVKMICFVNKGEIQVLMDNKRVISWKGGPERLSSPFEGNWKVPTLKHLTLGMHEEIFLIKKLDVTSQGTRSVQGGK